MRLATLAAFSLALVALPAEGGDELPPEEDYAVRVEYLLWSPRPTGQLQKGLGDLEGTLLDARADLALGKGAANAVRLAIRLGGPWKFRGSWSPLELRGDVEAERRFTYGTTAVRPGDRVLASLLGNYVTAEVEWDFLERRQGFLGLLAGVKYFDVDVALVNAATSSRVAETERVPVPVVGLAGRAYPHRRLSVEGEVSGLPAGDRGHVFEILLAARLHVVRRVAVTGGFRRLAFEGRDDRDYFDLGLGTWTLGVELSL